MYKSILVALDGSEFSASALPSAAAIARRTGATLHLVVVFDPSTMVRFVPGEASVPAFDVAVVNQRCTELRTWAEELAASIANTGVSTDSILLEGTVVEALLEQADAVQANLVIMTTHARSGLDRFRLGSVASSFLTRSPVPVFLMRPAQTPAPGKELPAGTLMVALDGSPFGESILPHARDFAEALGLAIELVQVVEPTAPPLALFGADALIVEDFVSFDEETAAQSYLADQAATLHQATPPTTTVLVDGSAGRRLVEHARDSNPSVVCLATHGRTGLKRLLLGSVADQLLRGVEQPVLIYRPSASESSPRESAASTTPS